jgi:hypothetical protein
MKADYTPEQFKANNFGNNFITIQSMLSADFAAHTDEHFAQCLDEVPKLNELLIDKAKCDNEEHYKQVLLMANVCLSMAMIERRLGVVKREAK